MNGGHSPIHVPLIGQQEQHAQQMMIAYYHSLYAQLIPVVASARLNARLRKVDESWMEDDVPPSSTLPDEIAREADEIAMAAMKRLGITIQKNSPA